VRTHTHRNGGVVVGKIKSLSGVVIGIVLVLFFILNMAKVFEGNDYILTFAVIIGGILVVLCILARMLATDNEKEIYEFKRRENKKYLAIIACVASVAIIIVSIIYIPMITYSHRFEALLLTAVQDGRTPVNFQSGGEKMVTYIFDENGYKFTSQFIPSDKKASRPEDVKIIVYVEKQKRESGSYVGGGRAYMRVYEVKLIDIKSWEILAQSSFTGGEPPKTVAAGASGIGRPPEEREIRVWISKQIG